MGLIPDGLAACCELKPILVLLWRHAHRISLRLAYTKRHGLQLNAAAVVVAVVEAAARPKRLEPKAIGALLLHHEINLSQNG